MLEWLIAALILLVAITLIVFSGYWWPRRRDPDSHSINFGGDYFRGLNYLLNEQPDKALEVFLQLAEVNPDTVETHLALGNLFRRRGEVDHAIRCHQNIIAKDSISPSERSHALLELAEDYRRAGLLDRAEDLYHQLAETSEGRILALKRLLEIYQQEQDWELAIRMAQRLLDEGSNEIRPLIAHFHCERASQALADNDLAMAREALAEARVHYPDSLRCRLLDAQILLIDGHPRRAIESLGQSLHHQPDLLPVALNSLIQSYTADHAISELQNELQDWLDQRHDVSATVALADLYQGQGQTHEARDLLLNQLQQRPNVRLLKAFVSQLSQQEYKDYSNLLQPIIERLCDDLLTGEVSFRCRQCGYGGHEHHWQCPSCKQWDSTWPIRGVTGE